MGRGSCRAVAGPPVVWIILAAGCVPEEKKASCAAMRDASSLSSAILSQLTSGDGKGLKLRES